MRKRAMTLLQEKAAQMIVPVKLSKLIGVAAASAVAVLLLGASSGAALAGHHHHHHCDNCGSGSNQNPIIAQPGSGLVNPGPPPLHGPGSSHNPIVYHPVHGLGSSHNPIVNTGSKWPPGTVVHDHRNGKNCSYTIGDRNSSIRFHRCERGF